MTTVVLKQVHDPEQTKVGWDYPATRPATASAAVDSSKISIVSNAFTVDLEDWAHGLLGGDTPITSRVLRNVDHTLDLLNHYHIKATFFALGRVCEKYPQLLPTIAGAGHEIASHGYDHEQVFKLTPEQFRDDLGRSIEIIGEQAGVRPLGYRAPQFSITEQSLWAGPILCELGFKYSSSMFPFAGPRYGIAKAPPYPFRWRDFELLKMQRRFKELEAEDCDLIEFPLTTLRWWGRRLPVCGGGYLRLLPVWFLETAIRQANRHGQPAVIYMHPYELDATEVSELRQRGWPIDWKVAVKQSMFRSFIKRRLAHLFQRFKFAPIKEILRV